MMLGKTTGTIFRAAGVMEAWVTRIPVWKLCLLMCWAKVRICFMPMLASAENSIQMVPIVGRGFGLDEVGRGVYFASIASVGLKEVVIFLRLKWRDERSVSTMVARVGRGLLLCSAIGIGEAFSKLVKRYAHFFFS